MKRTYPLFCATLTGWFREFGQEVSKVSPVVKHAECKGRGDPRCVFETRYMRRDLPSNPGVET